MTIGEKIKQLRAEKGFSQEYIYSNQSLVSQIEKGVNKNPTDPTLRLMAEKLEVTFDELIEGTDWEPKREAPADAEYAISRTEVNVKIEDSGQIIVKRKYYNAKDNNGNPRLYDPDTGIKLITQCHHCEYNIQRPEQYYCFGCGEKLFFKDQHEFMLATKYYMTWEGDEPFEVDEITGAQGKQFYDYDYSQSEVATDFTTNILTLKRYKTKVARRLAILSEFNQNLGNPFLTGESFYDIIAGVSDYLIKYLSASDQFEPTIYVCEQERKNPNRPADRPTYYQKWNNKKFLWELLNQKEIDNILLHQDSYRIIHYKHFKQFKPNNDDHWFTEFCVEMIADYSYHKGLLNELQSHGLRLLNMIEENQEVTEELDSTNPNES